MTLQVVTGKGAAVNGWHCLTEFMLEIYGADTGSSASCAAGGTIRQAGNSDWRGVAVGWGHTPPVLPGTEFQFKGNDVNGEGWQSSNDAAGTGVGGAIVERVHTFAPILRGEYEYYELYFSATGSMLAHTHNPIITDTGVQPSPIVPKGFGVLMDHVALPGIIEWDLELTGNLTKPSWQSDSVIDSNGNVWPVRRMGTWDATATYGQRLPNTSSAPIIQAAHRLELQATADPYYWDLEWCRLMKYPVSYKIENPDRSGDFITAQKITYGWTVWNGTSQGYIKTPAGSPVTLWP